MPGVRPPMGRVARHAPQVEMGHLRAWASRVSYHVALLLEKWNAPGSFPLTIPAIGIAFLLFLFLYLR